MQVASKLSPEDKATVERAVEDTIAWLDANQLAEVDELEHKCARPLTNIMLIPASTSVGTKSPRGFLHLAGNLSCLHGRV